MIDGAYYLLGWCLGEMNKDGESLQAMRALVCTNKYKPLDPPAPPSPTSSRIGGKGPKIVDPYTDCKPIKADSRFLPEAWTRVGEFHFDNSRAGAGDRRLHAGARLQGLALLRQGALQARLVVLPRRRLSEAIKRFDQLVVFSDKKKAESGAEGSDLRTEAVQYLGISFAEKDWNGDSIDDAETGLERIEKFYAGRENEPHVREIFAKLGDIYFDETEYCRAIEVYKRALQKWPYDPDNPKLQDRVVMAFERQRDFAHALRSARRWRATTPRAPSGTSTTATTSRRSARRRSWPSWRWCRRRSTTTRRPRT